MSLPESLQIAIEEETRSIKSHELSHASQELSQRYRDPSQRQEIMRHKQRFVSTASQRLAYVLARMPATFGAIKYVLNELKTRYSEDFHTVLDVGAGPGTAMWATSEVFPFASQIQLLEQDSSLLSLGKKLASNSSSSFIKKALWTTSDVLKLSSFPESDLIIVSYAMGEWPQALWANVVKLLWKSTKGALVIIEPGTMAGFQVIKQARQQLIDLDAHLVAPCPHSLKCPMPENDWCHFSTRIERSRLHRQMKGGSLGYEDEKFSYIIAARTQVELPHARILRHPLKRSGHICFNLCTKDHSLMNKTLSKRDENLYRQARDLEWGDSLPLES